MVKYVNETGMQIKQKHVDPYNPSGSQTNIDCLSCLSCYYFCRVSFISFGGKMTLTKGMNL
jgi:hypothetical protein